MRVEDHTMLKVGYAVAVMNRRTLFVISWGAVLLGVAAASACSSKAALTGQGGECFQATDCVEGLVCVPQSGGKSICTNDLSSVQSTEEVDAGADTAATPFPDGAVVTQDDGGAMIDSPVVVQIDSATPIDAPVDSFVAPPVDAYVAPPVDAYVAPVDAAHPVDSAIE